MKHTLKHTRIWALLLCAVMLAGMLAGCGGSSAPAEEPAEAPAESEAEAPAENPAEAPADDSTYTFTVATRAAEGDLVASTVAWFADEIASRTDGRVQLDIQYNGVLCSQGTEFEALESGICDIAVASLSSSADRWPSLGWVTVPGLISTYKEQHDALVAVQEAGYLDEELAANDVKLLWWQPAECFNFALTKTKVEKLDDLKGLKIGYAGGEYIGSTLNATGATGVGTNAADFYMSLSTGVLDGFVNPARYMYDAQFYEVVHYMPVGITCGGSNNSVYMSNRAFDSLPADLQEVFLQVCAEADQHFLDTAASLYENEYELLTEAGCECYELSDEVVAQYKELCAGLSDSWVSAQEASGNANAAAIRDLVLEAAAAA